MVTQIGSNLGKKFRLLNSPKTRDSGGNLLRRATRENPLEIFSLERLNGVGNGNWDYVLTQGLGDLKLGGFKTP